MALSAQAVTAQAGVSNARAQVNVDIQVGEHLQKTHALGVKDQVYAKDVMEVVKTRIRKNIDFKEG